MGLLLLGLLLAVPSAALDNGFSKPPLGFNPWNCFGIDAKGSCKLKVPGCHGFNRSVMLGVAKTIADSELGKAGYEYVNLDCGYSTGFRDSHGALQVNTTLYPGGMKSFGDAIHGMGLKFGIYSDAGAQQCCSRLFPNADDGSLDHEEQDAALFASWGVDFVKHDDCGSEVRSYAAMRDALNKTGRKIFYSVHTVTSPLQPGLPEIANSWRTTGDIDNTWDSIMERAVLNDAHAHLAGPGHFNDPDMLESGNLFGPYGDLESRSHFSMWAVMKAPLIIGTDVTKMTPATLATLSNREVIAINQDGLGVQAALLPRNVSGADHGNGMSATTAAVSSDPVLTWAGPLSGGDHVALAVNNLLHNATLKISLAAVLGTAMDVMVADMPAPGSMAASVRVRDVWAAKELGAFPVTHTLRFAGVRPHDCVLLRLSRG